MKTKAVKGTNNFDRIRNVLVAVFWIFLILLVLINRDRITIESIVHFTPENMLAAALIMLGLFTLKSITFFIYGSLLYVASGILFPLQMAIIVNLAGTFLMSTIPFWIGKTSGGKVLDHLIQKNPKLDILREIPGKNEFFVSFFVRIIGMLPADIVSMYLGASGIRYSRYIIGSMLGLFPAMLSFSVMGMSIQDVTSPAFIISAGCEIGLMVISITIYLILRSKKKRK